MMLEIKGLKVTLGMRATDGYIENIMVLAVIIFGNKIVATALILT